MVYFHVTARAVLAAALATSICSAQIDSLQHTAPALAPWTETDRAFESWRWRAVLAAPLEEPEQSLLDRSRAALELAWSERAAGRVEAAQASARAALQALMANAALKGRVERAVLVRSLARDVIERWPGEARTALSECVETLRRERPEGDVELLRAQELLALAEIVAGATSPGLARLEQVVLIAEQALFANDDELARLRVVLARELIGAQTDGARAQALMRAALDEAEAAAALDGLSLVRLLRASGQNEEAIERAERSVDALRRIRGPESLEVALACEELARCVSRAGDRTRALELYQTALAMWLSTSPESEGEIRNLRLNVARELENLERYEEAREVLEALLAQLERAKPEDERDLILVKARLATALLHTHDIQRAEVLANAAWRRCDELALGFEEFARRSAAQALDRALVANGRLDEAAALLLRQLEHYEATRSESDETLAWVRLRLAVRYKQAGRFAAALALEERVLDMFTATLGPEHIETLSARNNRARTLMQLGRLAEAGAELGELWTRLLAREPTPLLRSVRSNLVQLADKRGDGAALRDSMLEFLGAALANCGSHPALSRREAAEWAWDVGFEVGICGALSDTNAADAAVAERLFELVETSKSLQRSGYRSPAPFDADPESTRLRELVRRAREEVSAAAAADADRDTIERLTRERDRAERGFAARALELGARRVVIETSAVRAALRPDAAAVAYAVVDLFDKSDMGAPATSSLVAHVLRREGPVTRVDLGPLDERRREVEALRTALGVPLMASAVAPTGEVERQHAEALVLERLVDPVLAACGDASELIVALDGPLALIPLDALARPNGLLGESRRIRFVSSFAELAAPIERSSHAQSALVIGGVDYGGTAPAQVPSASTTENAAPTPRNERSHAFAPLRASAQEANDVAARLQRALESPLEHLSGKHATRARVLACVEQSRFLHAATHAWSAPTSQRSESFAPLSLVGLAFAGANDAVARATPHEAIVSAEELAGLDLHGLELAVLSACGTHAGVLTDGQGVQSLQAALHAAGAQWTVASLWPVEDTATRELMAAFYRELLHPGKPRDPSAALWAARMERRDAGEAYRNWAGWIATGVAR